MVKAHPEHGLTRDEREFLVDEQGGLCAICGEVLRDYDEFTDDPIDLVKACVDHDHKTGAIRGALCSNCNSMLGMAKDDPATLEAGAAYLRAGGSENAKRLNWKARKRMPRLPRSRKAQALASVTPENTIILD